MKKLILLCTVICTLTAKAQVSDHEHSHDHNHDHSHNHDHDEMSGHEEHLFVFKGIDSASKKECSLYVTEMGFLNEDQTPENFYAIVETNYSHGHDHAGSMKVQIVADKPSVLAGVSEDNNDQIVLFLGGTVLDLTTITSYNIKWLHGDHYHVNRCIDLKLEENDEENTEPEITVFPAS